jgi:RsiW-degrading membrane proteinase PrsW (M82 family)
VSKHEAGPDALDFLRAVARRMHYEMSGKHGSPARAWFARILVLWIVLAVDGSVLWNALLTIKGTLLVVFALFVTIRLVRWFFRRP